MTNRSYSTEAVEPEKPVRFTGPAPVMQREQTSAYNGGCLLLARSRRLAWGSTLRCRLIAVAWRPIAGRLMLILCGCWAAKPSKTALLPDAAFRSWTGGCTGELMIGGLTRWPTCESNRISGGNEVSSCGTTYSGASPRAHPLAAQQLRQRVPSPCIGKQHTHCELRIKFERLGAGCRDQRV